MRAIIIKPKLCCGISKGLGKVIEVAPHPKPGLRIFKCKRCSKKWFGQAEDYFLNVGEETYIEKNRVKILPDDLDLIEETETEKELQL